jgi:general secretion pathway protein I
MICFTTNHQKHQHGFTLIEVMVAVAIFAIAGAAILKATTEHIRSLSTLEQITMATWVANNRMTMTLIEARLSAPKKESKGEMEMAGRTWYWKQELTDTQDPSLNQVTIVIALDQDMNNEVAAVTSFLAKTSK